MKVGYKKDIIIFGNVVSFFKGKLYILSKRAPLKKTVKNTLKELLIDDVSGNIFWDPLDIIETSGNLYLTFLGLIDYKSINYDGNFKILDDKLTRIERSALSDFRKEISELNPTYLKAILGQEFLIRDLYGLYKVLVNERKDRANFYKLIRKKDYIVPAGRRKRDVYHRPPEYYKIRSR